MFVFPYTNSYFVSHLCILMQFITLLTFSYGISSFSFLLVFHLKERKVCAKQRWFPYLYNSWKMRMLRSEPMLLGLWCSLPLLLKVSRLAYGGMITLHIFPMYPQFLFFSAGKYAAFHSGAIPKLLALVKDSHSKVRLNCLKALTTLSETPEGRKVLLPDVNIIQECLMDFSEAVRRAAAIALQVIQWRPWAKRYINIQNYFCVLFIDLLCDICRKCWIPKFKVVIKFSNCYLPYPKSFGWSFNSVLGSFPRIAKICFTINLKKLKNSKMI